MNYVTRFEIFNKIGVSRNLKNPRNSYSLTLE